MPDISVQRAHFHERQFVGEALMNVEQSYHRDMRRRLNLGPHTQGIYAGLDLFLDVSNQLYLLPGMAVDVFGREILVLSSFQFDPQKFASFTANATVPIYIAYDWGAGQLPGSAAQLCDDPTQFDATLETFILKAGPISGSKHSQITVDGRNAQNDPNLPNFPDESFPYQELPTDDEAAVAWLFLGNVSLDAARKVVAVDMAGRTFAGAVAASILAPTYNLLLAPRLKRATDLSYQQDFATIDGALSVGFELTAGKNVHLVDPNAAIEFKDFGGDKFALHRTSNKELKLEIGKAGDKFAIAAGSSDLLSVDFDGTITVDRGKLAFAAAADISAATDFVESAGGQFKWQAGSTVNMSLTNSGDLAVTGASTIGKDMAVGGAVTVGGTKVTLPPSATTWVWAGSQALGFDPSRVLRLGSGWALDAAIISPSGGHMSFVGDLAVSGTLTAGKLVARGVTVPQVVTGILDAGDPTGLSSVGILVNSPFSGPATVTLLPSLAGVDATAAPWQATVGLPTSSSEVFPGTWSFTVPIASAAVDHLWIAWVALFVPA